uniref:Uncharacterized protein n=1 Tax=Oryza sativa subsp. japonica TaxID=39947 RepID=Q5Z5E3_ORYSJ|nr:hypothetical protein [Oryza sativa Japonica Group]BAD54626.1 hypothetical protein [Oryza sativa Japonica Group]
MPLQHAGLSLPLLSSLLSLSLSHSSLDLAGRSTVGRRSLAMRRWRHGRMGGRPQGEAASAGERGGGEEAAAAAAAAAAATREAEGDGVGERGGKVKKAHLLLDLGTPPGTCLAAASFALAGEAVVGAGGFSYTTTTTGFCCSGCGCVGGGAGDDDEEEGKAAQNALRSSSA